MTSRTPTAAELQDKSGAPVPSETTDTSLKIEMLAAAAHMANRAYCFAIGDGSQTSWQEAPDWQKESSRNGVTGVLNGNSAEDNHESWLALKKAEGWIYGEVKDAEMKTHPCMLPYADLPAEQQLKDEIFVSTVRSLAAVYDDGK